MTPAARRGAGTADSRSHAAWTPPPFPKRERAQKIEVYFCSVCGYAAGILDYDRIRHEHFENDRRCAHGHWRRERYVLAESAARLTEALQDIADARPDGKTADFHFWGLTEDRVEAMMECAREALGGEGG